MERFLRLPVYSKVLLLVPRYFTVSPQGVRTSSLLPPAIPYRTVGVVHRDDDKSLPPGPALRPRRRPRRGVTPTSETSAQGSGGLLFLIEITRDPDTIDNGSEDL